jgi:hypothetical protein
LTPYARIATKQAKFASINFMPSGPERYSTTKRKLIGCGKACCTSKPLKLLDPHNLLSIAIRSRTPNIWFRRGTILLTALDTLRSAIGPLSIAEIAERMIEAKGIRDMRWRLV